MLRFSIRDVLWLTVVAALAVGWWIDSRSNRQAQIILHEQMEALKGDVFALQMDVLRSKVNEAQLQAQLKQAEIETIRLQLVPDSSTARAGDSEE